MKAGKVQPAGAERAALQDHQEETLQPPVNCEVRRGADCPICGRGRMDYDGLLNLVCPNCGFTSGGSFT